MSRELLKRVIAECADSESRSNITAKLYCEVAEYLEMPEPEPVASINGWHGGYPTIRIINGAVLPAGMALYAASPDQSAQIAELIAQRSMQEEIIKSAYARCKELSKELKPLTDDQLDSLRQSEVVVTYYPVQQEPSVMSDFLDFINRQVMVNTAYEYLMLALMACVMIGMLMMAIPALLATAVYFTVRAIAFGEWGRLYDKTSR